MTLQGQPHQSNVITEMGWADFLMWAIGDENMRAQFEAETGQKFMSPPANGIEAMIDEVTGSAKSQAFAFMRWATINHYGIEYIPIEARKMIEESDRAQ